MGSGDRGFAHFVSAGQARLHRDRISRYGPPSAYVRRALGTTHASWRRRLSTTERSVTPIGTGR